MTRTWTLKEIHNEIAKTLLVTTCPRCPDMMTPALALPPSVIETCGPWVLSVGCADVMVTVPAVCHTHCHRFILRVDLWRRARTPIGGIRVKNKLVCRVPQRPRPLFWI